MDWSVALGIVGIMVSVAVGWLTYKLADRRSRNQRYLSAKATVLQELANSLGEDAVPNRVIIESTIRSVLRESGDPRIKVEVEEILDDLTRQVTSDPFLDAERRKKLQQEISAVRKKPVSESPGEGAYPLERFLRASYTTTFRPGLLGILAATLTLATTLSLLLGEKSEGSALRQFLAERSELLSVLPVFFLVPLLVWMLWDDDLREVLLRVFRRKRR